MELKNGMTVIAPCDCDYIKKGQEFVVSDVKIVIEPYMYGFNINIEGFRNNVFCLLLNAVV